MRAGPLTQRITIQALPADSGTDSYGAPLNDWATLYASVPARISPLTGRELIAAQQVADGATVEIETRYLPGVTGKVRAVDDEDGTIYDILFPQDVDKLHRQLILLCSSGLTQG